VRVVNWGGDCRRERERSRWSGRKKPVDGERRGMQGASCSVEGAAQG